MKKKRAESIWFAFWVGTATFLTYFCMYLFRKPYTAGTFETLHWMGMDYKMALVIAQVIGYALAKLFGIRFISSLELRRRIPLLLILLIVSGLSLLGFAFASPNWGPVWMFCNGFPLGLIWGIVFTYCEGRRMTEMMTVILASNFIITSGIAKSAGRWVMEMGVSEFSMPIVIAGLSLPLLFGAIFMLKKIAPPTQGEVDWKSARVAMSSSDRRQMLRIAGTPIFLFVAIYLVLTVIRDVRDNFAVEIWRGLGFAESPEIFTTAELPVLLITLLGLGFLYKINNHGNALNVNILFCVMGMVLIVLLTLGQKSGAVSPFFWMVFSGASLFIPYILFNGIIFDRFIGHFSLRSNVGFIMYIADAVGYLGSVGVLVLKHFFQPNLNWLDFYRWLILGGGVCVLFLLLLLLRSLYVMNQKQKRTDRELIRSGLQKSPSL